MAKYKFISKYNIKLKGGHDASSLILNASSLFDDYIEVDEHRDEIYIRDEERDDSDLVNRTDLHLRRAWRDKQLLDMKVELIGLCRCLGDYDMNKLTLYLDPSILAKSSIIEKRCLSNLKKIN
jgi:hypothetical protein